MSDSSYILLLTFRTLSGSFPIVAADVEKRRRFARECVGLIQDYGFDGIDIGKLLRLG